MNVVNNHNNRCWFAPCVVKCDLVVGIERESNRIECEAQSNIRLFLLIGEHVVGDNILIDGVNGRCVCVCVKAPKIACKLWSAARDRVCAKRQISDGSFGDGHRLIDILSQPAETLAVSLSLQHGAHEQLQWTAGQLISRHFTLQYEHLFNVYSTLPLFHQLNSPFRWSSGTGRRSCATHPRWLLPSCRSCCQE